MTVTTFVRVLAASLVLTLAAVMTGCAQEDLGGAPLKNGDASKTYEGTRFTPSQVASELRAAGFPEDTVGKMLCTAKYESTYYERASGRDGRLVTRGLLMISSKYAGELKGCPADADELYDVKKNVKCGYAVFKAEGLDAWGTSYGRHKSECDKTKAPPAPGATPTDVSVPASVPDPADVSEQEGGPTPTTNPPAPTTPATPAQTTPAPTPATPAPTTPATPAPATPAPAPAPAAPATIVGGCFSNTLQDTMEPMACVESKFDLVWQQCKDGKWYRGGDDTTGKFGACNGSFPLPE